jgi:hypothetical protein
LHRGLTAKLPQLHLLPLAFDRRRTGALAGSNRWRPGRSPAWPRRGIERGGEGDLGLVLTGGGERRERPESKGTTVVDHSGRLGLHAAAAFRCLAGDGERRSTCGSAPWSSRWRPLAPVVNKATTDVSSGGAGSTPRRRAAQAGRRG